MLKRLKISIIFITLAAILTGCSAQGTSEITSSTGNQVSTETENSEELNVSSNYVQGICTDEFYASEWLNLYVNYSENQLRNTMYPGTINAYRSASIFGDDTVLEMCAAKRSNDFGTVEIKIYVSETNGRNLDDCISDMTEAYNQNNIDGNYFNVKVNNAEEVVLLGEEYQMVLTSVTSTHNMYYGTVDEYATNNIWNLYRIKEDKIICISYNDSTCSYAINDLLNYFTTSDNANEYSSSTLANNDQEYSIWEIEHNIQDTFSNAIISNETTYERAIDKLFINYTWEYQPLSTYYKNIYIVTITGDYYLSPSSYYQLNDSIGSGSCSFLVYIIEKINDNMIEISAYHGNNDDTGDISSNLTVIASTR